MKSMAELLINKLFLSNSKMDDRLTFKALRGIQCSLCLQMDSETPLMIQDESSMSIDASSLSMVSLFFPGIIVDIKHVEGMGVFVESYPRTVQDPVEVVQAAGGEWDQINELQEQRCQELEYLYAVAKHYEDFNVVEDEDGYESPDLLSVEDYELFDEETNELDYM